MEAMEILLRNLFFDARLSPSIPMGEHTLLVGKLCLLVATMEYLGSPFCLEFTEWVMSNKRRESNNEERWVVCEEHVLVERPYF